MIIFPGKIACLQGRPEKLLLYVPGDEFWKKTPIVRTESWEVSYGFVLAQGKIEKKGQSGMCSNDIIVICIQLFQDQNCSPFYSFHFNYYSLPSSFCWLQSDGESCWL